MVYDVPITKVEATVEAMQQMARGYLWRWIAILRDFSSAGLYSSGAKLQLLPTSITEKFRVTEGRQLLMLRKSKESKVRNAGSDLIGSGQQRGQCKRHSRV
jgi:hypothetical protein